jgi:hypothetical protein
LLADLESNEFAVRRKAVAELEKLGEQVEAALRQHLESKPPLEARRRVEALLDKLKPLPLSGEQLRMWRVIRCWRTSARRKRRRC